MIVALLILIIILMIGGPELLGNIIGCAIMLGLVGFVILGLLLVAT